MNTIDFVSKLGGTQMGLPGCNFRLQYPLTSVFNIQFIGHTFINFTTAGPEPKHAILVKRYTIKSQSAWLSSIICVTVSPGIKQI